MGDLALRRPATLLIVFLAAILLLLAAAGMGRATLAVETSGHNGPVPAVINAGSSNHLTVAPTHHSDEEDSSHEGDGGD